MQTRLPPHNNLNQPKKPTALPTEDKAEVFEAGSTAIACGSAIAVVFLPAWLRELAAKRHRACCLFKSRVEQRGMGMLKAGREVVRRYRGRCLESRLRRGLLHVKRSQAALCHTMQIDILPSTQYSLCTVSTVQLLRRVNAEKIGRMADCGELQWVWDVSAGTAMRDLRILFGEVVAPQMYARLSIDEVVDRILPRGRKFFFGSQVCQIVLFSRNQLLKHAVEMQGAVRNRAYHIPREGLANWLKARHLGGSSR